MQSPFGDWLPEVVVMRPLRFEAGQTAIAAIREQKTVLIDCTAMEADQAQRLLDVIAGGVYAVDGDSACLEERVFLFTPVSVAIRRQSGDGPASARG